MRIRPKVISLLGGLFLLLGGAQLFIQHAIVLPGFTDLERQAASTDMERATNVIADDLRGLQAVALDWGDWDLVYEFVQTHDSRPLAANLDAQVMRQYRTDAVAVLDLAGAFRWQKSLAASSGPEIDLFARGALPADHPWHAALLSGRPASGLLRTNRGPMLTVIAPVLNGNGQGPARGAVLIGRLLSPREIERIGQQARVRLSADELPPGVGAEEPRLITRNQLTEVHSQLAGLDGAPLLHLRIEVPRAISARGRMVVRYASVFLLTTGTVALLAVILVLNHAVLEPLARVTRHAVQMGRAAEPHSKLELQRADEIGELAREFDRMLERLQAAQRQLIDRSYDAGRAQNATGVLHNLGNAMTPLCVRLGMLQESVRASPAADIERVLDELEGGGPASTRTAQLERFLRLSSRDLAHGVIALGDELQAIARNTQAIEAVLAEQRSHSASCTYESVRLSNLVRESLELIPPDRQARLTLEIDESLQRMGPLRLPRTLLQQVFQNLILNAAEAVPSGASARIRLRARARVDGGLEDGTLQVSFEDDGVGIPPENLSRIFERGFSTKSGARNAGIGLHWCANAVNALHGSLRAESAGAACGTTLHVRVPLNPPAAGIDLAA